MWQNYYVFRKVWYIPRNGQGSTKWCIDYGYGEKVGQQAIKGFFRNERLAIRAVERLYKREHGDFEGIVLGANNE